MAGPWLLLLLALGCPAQPAGVSAMPFPSLAPPITLLVDGKQQTLVVCLVLDVEPPGLDSPIWFSAGNGSLLDAFTYGPSPAADGTWTSLAQLSLPSKELAAWEPLVCHTGLGAGGRGWSTQPLQLSGEASSVRTCIREPVQGMQSRALRLAALRLLLFKLLLLDVLLTCSRLRALRAAPADPSGAPPPGGWGSPCGRGPRGPTAFSSRRRRRSKALCFHPLAFAAGMGGTTLQPPSRSAAQEPNLGGGDVLHRLSLGQPQYSFLKPQVICM